MPAITRPPRPLAASAKVPPQDLDRATGGIRIRQARTQTRGYAKLQAPASAHKHCRARDYGGREGGGGGGSGRVVLASATTGDRGWQPAVVADGAAGRPAAGRSVRLASFVDTRVAAAAAVRPPRRPAGGQPQRGTACSPTSSPLDVGTVRARPAAGGSRTARARVAVADLVPSPPNVPAAAASPTAASAQPLVTIDVDAAGVATRDVATACNLRFRSDAGRVTECLSAVFRQPASPLELHGDAAPTVMAVRLETDGDVPGLSAVSGRLRFDDSALFSDGPTGALGSLPPTVVGCLDVERGYDVVGAVQPVAVDAPRHVCGAPCVTVVATVRGQARMSGPHGAPVVASGGRRGGGGSRGGGGEGGAAVRAGGHVGAAADAAGGAGTR
ncbi:LOW QUALITY PROTEIN: hypothetical protein BU14_0072s0064 [Porphyra umbilicalis]|uniref:Uncharacterized protein n=1 Tax=Porphyra umbilicalis TaxID=2786 RepID=A0A1X6PG38_PORUM|nr:LOW QUALITY PROTEIN: hypothetical protein BU14_0072s0064 [Porphyra umbilicalis]|eukprot:OSX79706.1 LOW QUALITY PROTEIN: hypothetical protein BU14_0072s0064 [Porphyra umbilicalis]